MEIPKAIKIINSVIKEFEEWVENRKFAPTIRALKNKLTSFKNLELENIKKKKVETSIDELCEGLPNEFKEYMEYVR